MSKLTSTPSKPTNIAAYRGNTALSRHSSPAYDTTEEDDIQQQVFRCFPNAPIEADLVIPKRYTVSKNGIHLRRTDKDGVAQPQCIAESPILVSKRFRDVDTGEESLEVAWQRDGWQTTIVNRAILMNSTKITELASKGFPVNSVNAGGVIKYVSAFEAENLEKIPLDFVTHHLGWQGKDGAHGFLLGSELITADDIITGDSDTEHHLTFRGLSDGDAQIVEGFHRHGTLNGWIQGIAPIANYPKVLLNVYAAFVPPLLNIYKCGNFTTDVSARTSVGKSTVQSIAASVCGNPDLRTANPVIHTWNTTRVYFERLCAVSTDLPVFLDDTKQARRPEEVEASVYDLHNGQGRGRGNTKGLERSVRWRSVLLSTGEAQITSFTNSGGTRGRVLALNGLPFGSDKMAKLVNELNAAVSEHYGHALPLFVQWVLAHKDEWDTWQTEYRAERDRLAACEAAQDSIAGRLAHFMAAVTYTANLVHRAFEDNNTPLLWQYSDELLADAWTEIAVATEDAPVDIRALRDVFSWAQSNESKFHDSATAVAFEPANGWLGKWGNKGEWGYVAFHTRQLKDFLSKAGYKPEEVINGWRDRKWLKTRKDGSPSASERMGATTASAYVIWRQALVESGCTE